MTDELLARIRRIEDRIELSDLVARYGRLVDDRDVDGLRDLWTDDAVFDSVEGPVRGRDTVVDYYVERMRMFGPSFHVPHSQTVDFDGPDTATGIVTAHAELGMEDGAFWVALRYHDQYRREEGTWKFHQRQVRQLYAMPLRELADDLAAPARKRWPDTTPAVAELPESLDTWTTWLEPQASP